jgi:hypothetical protein
MSLAANAESESASVKCRVTIPRKAPVWGAKLFGSGSSHWKGQLYVGGLGDGGTIVGRTNDVESDGSVGRKLGWYRRKGVHGKLKIYGKRLDADAPPLRAIVPDGYGDTGFQASGVYFPTEGCWQVTGEVGTARLIFVTRIIKEL